MRGRELTEFQGGGDDLLERFFGRGGAPRDPQGRGRGRTPA